MRPVKPRCSQDAVEMHPEAQPLLHQAEADPPKRLCSLGMVALASIEWEGGREGWGGCGTGLLWGAASHLFELHEHREPLALLEKRRAEAREVRRLAHRRLELGHLLGREEALLRRLGRLRV